MLLDQNSTDLKVQEIAVARSVLGMVLPSQQVPIHLMEVSFHEIHGWSKVRSFHSAPDQSMTSVVETFVEGEISWKNHVYWK